mgnify:CR=1 FL=1
MIGFDFPFPTQEPEGRMNMALKAHLATLEKLVACFEDLEDPCSEVNRKHPRVSVVSISISPNLNCRGVVLGL